MAKTMQDYKQIAQYIQNKLQGFVPELGLILGSGLGDVAKNIENPIEIPYKEIPGFLESTAPSQASKLICGIVKGRKVACLSGRFHSYEGYSDEDLALPIRILHLIGVRACILTNAAGCVNQNYIPGRLMLIKDHINLGMISPMRGKNMDEFGPRFFDTTEMYTPALQEFAKACAKEMSFPLEEGTYMFMPGPQYETPAEVRAIRILGGDAVGMSTVSEALTAAHCGMPVLAFSFLSNMAAGSGNILSTEEVETAGKEAAPKLIPYIYKLIETFPKYN